MAMSKDRKKSRTSAASEIDITYYPSDSISLHSITKDAPLPAAYSESKDALLASNHLGTQPFGRPRRPPHATFSWRKPFSLSTITFIGHLLLTLSPALFLILSFGAWAVNNDPVTSSRGQIVEQAAKLGPTLFPIIFAAVCSRLMRTYALWRAEKGEALGILEQMNGSQNLLAALERAILIPGLGFLSTGIVLLWLLSPVGGQSSLRVLGRGTSTALGKTPLYYFNTTSPGDPTAFEGSSSYSDLQAGLNAVFQAALTSLERVKGRDTWGNVKIPVLQYMADQVEVDDWHEFDENKYNEPYSALNGLVISGLRDGMNFNFTLESSYYNLTCTGPAFFNTSSSTDDLGGFTEYGAPFVYHTVNGSFKWPSPWADKNQWNSYMVDTNYNHTTRTDPLPRYNIIYASLYGDGDQADTIISAYNCTVGITYAESDLLCTGRSCQVRRIRLSHKFGPSYSGWSWLTNSGSPVPNLLGWLGTATSMTGNSQISPVDAYVSGSNTPFSTSDDVNYQNITADQVAKRLQSLVNTGWQLAYQGSATAQEPNGNLTALALLSEDALSSSTAWQMGVNYPVGTIMATTVATMQIFVVHKVWLSVNIIVSFILLFCSISGMVFRYKSHCPDIFGFVSSMTRDNPNFEHVPGGDKMDGLQRARAMRHVRVQVVDIAPWGEGHITLKDVGTHRSGGETIQ